MVAAPRPDGAMIFSPCHEIKSGMETEVSQNGVRYQTVSPAVHVNLGPENRGFDNSQYALLYSAKLMALFRCCIPDRS